MNPNSKKRISYVYADFGAYTLDSSLAGAHIPNGLVKDK